MTDQEGCDISRIIGPDAPDILHEFAGILQARHVAEVKRINDLVLETYRAKYERILRTVMARRGCSADQAATEASVAALPVRERLDAGRRKLIEEHFDWFRGAVQNLLAWWEENGRNPEN